MCFYSLRRMFEGVFGLDCPLHMVTIVIAIDLSWLFCGLQFICLQANSNFKFILVAKIFNCMLPFVPRQTDHYFAIRTCVKTMCFNFFYFANWQRTFCFTGFQKIKNFSFSMHFYMYFSNISWKISKLM